MRTLNETIIPTWRTSVLLGLFFIGLTCSTTRVLAQSSTCFSTIAIEPGFIAFSTDKESKLADWYQTTFGLNVVKKFSFPDGSVTGVLMNRGEFVVEVFNRDTLSEQQGLAKETTREQSRGVMKFGIYTDANLLSLKHCLNNLGVKAGRIFNDKNLKIDLLQLIDPEQNVLEIISRTIVP